MQASMQPPPPPPAVTMPPPAVTMPPPPPASADPAAQMAWMRDAVQLVQQMQAALQHPAQPAPLPPHQPPPQPSQPQMMGPTRAPPPGMIWIWEPEFGFVLTPVAQAAPQEPPRGPYRGPFRPSYGPQNEPGSGAPPYSPTYPGPSAPPRPQTAAEQFREAASTIRMVRSMVDELGSILPGQEAPAEAVAEDDDSPIKVIDTGVGKLVVNKSDGAMRWGETGMIALPGILKWLGEQREAIQKAHQERQAQPRQQLPPGYVEVGPGYRPPPGFVAVPVDSQQAPPPDQGLPPPPTQVPPPISAPPQWGMPSMPFGQGEQ
jgi:hypothetical protein